MAKGKREGYNLLRRPRKKTGMDFACGFVLGAAVFLLVYGPSTLNVTYDGWIYAGYMEMDVVQHYTGWLWYRAAPWSWPLTVAENLSIPYGASVAFTDSIPLVAVVCKALSPVLPATFQYFGWVNFLNLCLQGGFGFVLLRSFDLDRVFSAIGAVFFAASPVLLERTFRHAGLGAQWLILAALWLYFLQRRENRLPIIGFWVLCQLSISIHTYFTPMVYALLAAALLDWGIRNRRLLYPLVCLGACFAGSFGTGYVLGLVTRGGGGASFGFGTYSMNLNALYNPSSFDWFSEEGHLSWSALIPVQPQNPRQYDGFNYLGLGILVGVGLLLLFGLVYVVRALVQRDRVPLRRAGYFLKGHIPLLVVCACLTVFALSNIVVFNTTTLFAVPLPDKIQQLCAIFRSSGRMLWLCYYLIYLSVMLAAARLLRGKLGHILLAVLLAVQLLDMGGTLVQKRQYFSECIEVENGLFNGEVAAFMQSYRYAECLGNLFDYELAASLIRYNPDMRSNIIITNRGEFPVIAAGYEEMQEYLMGGGALDEGTIYLCSDEETFAALLAGLHPDGRGYVVGGFYAVALPVEGNPLPEVLPASA